MNFNLQERLSKIKAIALDVDGTLTDGKLYIGGHGEEFKAFNVEDGLGIYLWKLAGNKCFIITGRNSLIVGKRAEELDVDEVMQGVVNKKDALIKISERHDLSLEEIAFIGDDLNDIPCFDICGFSIAPNQACDYVKNIVDRVLNKNGGEGAIREAIEYILKAQNKLEKTIKLYIKTIMGERE